MRHAPEMVVLALVFACIAAVPLVRVDSAVAADCTPVDLSAYFNNDGISWDSDPLDGDLDFGRRSLPAEQLPAPGEIATLAGVPFAFPSAEDGKDNNVLCFNQVIELPAGRYGTLAILVTSVSGTRKVAFTVTYADGSTASLSQRIPDMGGAPGFAKYVAVETDHRHSSEGDETPGARLYAFSFGLDPNKEVASLALPEMAAVRLFAITLLRATQ